MHPAHLGLRIESEYPQFLVAAARFRDTGGPCDGLLTRGKFEHGEPAVEPWRPGVAAFGDRAVRRDAHGCHLLIDAPSGDDNNRGPFGEPKWLKSERGYTAHDQPGELFNLREDPAQKHNRYAEQPQLVAELKALLKKYQTEGRSTPGTAQANDVPLQPFVPVASPSKGKAKRP